MTARRWPLGLLLGVLAFGVFAGTLMTWHHEVQAYGSGTQGPLVGCEESATVNCDLVNTSEWSELGGVPIATFAVVLYLTLAAITVLVLRGRKDLQIVLVVAGIGATLFSAVLFYVSKFQLGFVCSWCIRMYAVNVSILVLSLLAGKPSRPAVSALVPVGIVGAVALVLAVGAQKIHRGTLNHTDLARGGSSKSSDDKIALESTSYAVTNEDNQPATMVLNPSDAWKGNPKAKVVLVEFADLECGFCKRASAELKRLVESYGDRVLFVFKHFPLDPTCNPIVKNKRHPYACGAALAARCAQEQGKFWAFHDLAYKNQHQLGAVNLRQYAQQVGVDLPKFEACISGGKPNTAIRSDAELGGLMAVHGTPRIYINGKVYRGGTAAEAIAKALEEALGSTPENAQLAAKSLHVDAAVAAIAADVPAMRAVSLDAMKFSIDTFEAALEEGKAVSGKHKIPATRMSWYAARDACAAAGKRLCTEQEWVSACQNATAKDDNGNGQFADDMIEGTAYPYGDYHEADRCWDDKEGEQFRPVFTGEMPGCAGKSGIYDLTGNVEEWVGDSPEHAVMLGGAWDTKDDHARCYRRNDTFGAAYSSPRSGFRCCGP